MTIIPFQRGLTAPEEVPAERARLETVHTQLTSATDPAVCARLLGQLGELRYRLGDAEGALPLVRQAVALAEAHGNARLLAAQRLRLATALQYANHHAEAESVFRQGLAAKIDPAASVYADFFLQHLGKCLAEMGRVLEAMVCFEEALALRQAKGDASLLASTMAALTGARELLISSGE